MEGRGTEDGTEALEAVEGGSEESSSTESESPQRESARESAQRAWEELSKEGAGSDNPEGQAEANPANPNKPGDPADAEPEQLEAAEKPLKPIDPDDIPPERFDAEEKAMYQRLPKVARRSVKKHIKGIESWAGRKVQEASVEVQKARGETREIMEVARPYIQDIYARGMSIPQAMARLLSTHAQLTHQDENERTKRWLEIGMESSVSPKVLQQIQNLVQAGELSPNTVQNPEIKELRENYERVNSQLQEWQLQQQASPIAAEMRTVIDKVDPVTKQPLYPELQNGSLGVARPLVEELVNRVPGISYAQALECSVLGLRADSSSYEAAYQEACRAFYTGNFNQPSPSRPPTSTISTQQRAVSAGFSARGNSAGSSQNQGDFGKIPDWARKDATSTARWIAQQMSRGV